MYVKFLFCLDAFKCCGCNYLLIWEVSWCITWNEFSFSHIWLTFRSFWLWLIVSVPIICLNDVLLWKTLTGVALNTFPNVLLIFNICQFLLITFLMFGNIRLYLTENGITFFHAALVLFNRVVLSRLSTFSIWLQMMFSLYPFSMNRLTKSFECFLYSPKVEQTCFIVNAWLYGILFFSERGCADFAWR